MRKLAGHSRQNAATSYGKRTRRFSNTLDFPQTVHRQGIAACTQLLRQKHGSIALNRNDSIISMKKNFITYN